MKIEKRKNEVLAQISNVDLMSSLCNSDTNSFTRFVDETICFDMLVIDL